MQDSAIGGGGGGGVNELSRTSGLARFRSAPATWLDALLEDDDSLKLSGPHHHHQSTLTQLLTSGTTTTTTTTTTNSSTGPSSGSNSGPPARPAPTFNMSSSSSSVVAPDPSYFDSGTHHQETSNNNNNMVAFQRMNSSPAEFLSANMEGYFSYGGGYDFVGGSSNVDVLSSPSKRMRENDNNTTDNYSPLRRGEQSGQLSTANSLVELEMEKLLEDSVPCRVRAKRGCATHPRSIAERVRRTRISDRIRKLQELVPNMDKQTNTADMLEEAVEYVKTLQRQIQELTEQQKKCKCMAKN